MKCKGCGTEDCNARELHERVAASVGAKEYNELRQVLTDHGIKLPASWGRSKEEDAFLRSIVVALVKLENEVHGADVEHPPTPAWPEEPPEDPVDNTFFDTYPSPPAPRKDRCLHTNTESRGNHYHWCNDCRSWL